MAHSSHTDDQRPRSSHASPAEALEAPRERLLYLACLHEGTGVDASDFIAVVDADPDSGSYGQIIDETPMPNVGDELHHFGLEPLQLGMPRARPLAPDRAGFRSSRIHILDVAADPRRPRIDGGPQMLQLSLDGRRLYVTNSLYSTWDNQFYPELRSWLLKVDCDPEGGMEVDRDFFVDLHERPGGGARGAPRGGRLHHGDLPMTVIAHHGGEQLILTAAIGSGLLSGSLLVLRARMAELARRRRRRQP